MHIPTADTDTLELLPFREALEKSGQRGDYDAARWLYVPDFYTEYRYILGTRGEKPLICIGVNPSTAAAPSSISTVSRIVTARLPNRFHHAITSYLLRQNSIHFQQKRCTSPLTFPDMYVRILNCISIFAYC